MLFDISNPLSPSLSPHPSTNSPFHLLPPSSAQLCHMKKKNHSFTHSVTLPPSPVSLSLPPHFHSFNPSLLANPLTHPPLLLKHTHTHAKKTPNHSSHQLTVRTGGDRGTEALIFFSLNLTSFCLFALLIGYNIENRQVRQSIISGINVI